MYSWEARETPCWLCLLCVGYAYSVCIVYESVGTMSYCICSVVGEKFVCIMVLKVRLMVFC